MAWQKTQSWYVNLLDLFNFNEILRLLYESSSLSSNSSFHSFAFTGIIFQCYILFSSKMFLLLN